MVNHRSMLARFGAVLLASMTVVTGCGSATTRQEPGSVPAQPGYPVTVQNCGRTLTFNEPPKRAVTYYQVVLEMMLALGLGSHVVGREGFAESPRLPEQESAYQSIHEMTPGPNPPTREQMLATNPDFVFVGQASYELDSKRGFATREQLESAGANVYITEARCTDEHRASMADVYQDLRNLGAIFGVAQQAEALITQMRTRIEAVQAKVAGRPPVSVMVYLSGTGPLTIAGGSYFDLPALAGGHDIFSDRLGHTSQVSPEQVVELNPQVFIIDHYQPGPAASEKRDFLFETFPTVQATKDRRSVTVENIEIAPGIRNPDVLERIARVLHGEAF